MLTRIIIVIAIALAGCTFRLNGEHPPVTSDLATTRPHDMAVASAHTDMSSHTQAADLAMVAADLAPPDDMTPTPRFRSDVQNVLDGRGCSAATCHQSYAPLIIPTPHTDPQWQQNYTNVLADVAKDCDMATASECAASSLLLTKPLAGSGVAHAGGIKPFASDTDPDYLTLLIWIEEGTKK